jgi:predicted DNA-binding transcriptional regulator YafY
MSPGRYDAEALAQELGCSTRTVHRILRILSEAGIPYRFDSDLKAYRVPRDFRFRGLEPVIPTIVEPGDPKTLLPAAKRLSGEMERFARALKEFCDTFESESQ